MATDPTANGPINKDDTHHVHALLERLADELRDLITKATRDFDPVAVSALRIGHAVLVAVRRRDQRSLDKLREWQNSTLAYMQESAFDEYLAMPVPPLPGRHRRDHHDRHLILAALRTRVAKYLERRDSWFRPRGAGIVEEMMNKSDVAHQLQAMVERCFPNLKPVDEPLKRRLLGNRIRAHTAAGRPLKELDPEDVIKDALEALGAGLIRPLVDSKPATVFGRAVITFVRSVDTRPLADTVRSARHPPAPQRSAPGAPPRLR